MSSSDLMNQHFSLMSQVDSLEVQISDAQRSGDASKLKELRTLQTQFQNKAKSLRDGIKDAEGGEQKEVEISDEKRAERAQEQAHLQGITAEQAEAIEVDIQDTSVQGQEYGYESTERKDDNSGGLKFLDDIPYGDDKDEVKAA